MLHCCRRLLAYSVVLVLLVDPLHSRAPASWKDPSPHARRFVRVDKNTKLEVLDWGTSGTPIVLLAGNGDTAHVFDEFAPKLAAYYHVYGITRRGFGASVSSATDYGADRLGDDVLVIIEFLKLKKPVLVGHSIGGEELSSVASRYPDRVRGVVYLDAGYPYAFDNAKGPSEMEFLKIQGPQPPPPAERDLASFGALQKYFERVNGFRFPESELRQEWQSTPDGRAAKPRDFPASPMILRGMKKYTRIPVPALFIFANPHSQGAWVDNSTDPIVRKSNEAYSVALSALTERQQKAIEEGVPRAHMITLPGASHYIFLSNEADVLGEIRTFVAGLTE
jgi:non-heme chloroperoxidase